MRLQEALHTYRNFPLKGQPLYVDGAGYSVAENYFTPSYLRIKASDPTPLHVEWEDEGQPGGWRWLGDRKVNLYRGGERYAVGIQWMIPDRLLDAPVIYVTLKRRNEYCGTCARSLHAPFYGIVFDEGAALQCHGCRQWLESRYGDPNE